MIAHFRVAFVGLLIGASLVGADSYRSGGTRALFPSLSDSGSAVTSTQPFLAPSGTVGAPGYAFSTDTDLGFYRVSDNIMHFVAGAVDRIRIQPTGINIASSTGSLGFGSTSAPDTSLARTAAGFLSVTSGFDKPAASTAAASPATNNVRFYVREDIDQSSGAATDDCALVARLSDDTEVTIQVLVTDAGC